MLRLWLWHWPAVLQAGRLCTGPAAQQWIGQQPPQLSGQAAGDVPLRCLGGPVGYGGQDTEMCHAPDTGSRNAGPERQGRLAAPPERSRTYA